MAEPYRSEKHQSKTITRSVILQHSFEMYLDRRLQPGNESLTDVLRELGYMSGVGYSIWPNNVSFREDLAVFIAENIEYASLRNLASGLDDLLARGLSYEDHVLRGGDHYARTYIGREEFYLMLRFFSEVDRHSEPLKQAIQDAYERASWEAKEYLGSLLSRFARRTRDGVSLDDLANAVTALVEGYALRARIQPEKAQPSPDGKSEHHPFSEAFLALLTHYTEPAP